MWNNQKQQKVVFFYVKFKTYNHFKLDFQKLDQQTGGKWLIHGTNTARTISCKAWNTPLWNILVGNINMT